jgi:VanZ family protein
LEVIVINGTKKFSGARSGFSTRIGRPASLFLPPIVVMAAIFVLSSHTSDPTDRTVWELLLRKLGHVSEYFLLTLAWARALGARWAAAALISVLYASTDELHQTYVAGRHGTPVDVLIDAIGVSLACLLYARRRRRTVGPSRPSAA